MDNLINFPDKRNSVKIPVKDGAEDKKEERSEDKTSTIKSSRYAVIYSNIPIVVELTSDWKPEEHQLVKRFDTIEEAKAFSASVLEVISMLVIASHTRPSRVEEAKLIDGGVRQVMLIEQMLNWSKS
jgi:hypothetical protein